MLDFPRWKVLSIFGFLAVLMALAIPSFFPEDMTKGWPVHPRINLGLDLAGGSYLLLEADTSQLVTDRVNLMSDSVATAMRKAPRIDIGDITTDGGKVSFMLRNVAQLEDARQRLSQMTTGAQMTGQRDWDIQVVDSTRFVITPTKAGVDEAIDSAMSGATEVVRRRIDRIDHWRVNSNVLGDYDAMLSALAEAYPAARIKFIAGERAPLQALRAELDRRQEAIDQWLKEAAESQDE